MQTWAETNKDAIVGWNKTFSEVFYTIVTLFDKHGFPLEDDYGWNIHISKGYVCVSLRTCIGSLQYCLYEEVNEWRRNESLNQGSCNDGNTIEEQFAAVEKEAKFVEVVKQLRKEIKGL